MIIFDDDDTYTFHYSHEGIFISIFSHFSARYISPSPHFRFSSHRLKYFHFYHCHANTKALHQNTLKPILMYSATWISLRRYNWLVYISL